MISGRVKAGEVCRLCSIGNDKPREGDRRTHKRTALRVYMRHSGHNVCTVGDVGCLSLEVRVDPSKAYG